MNWSDKGRSGSFRKTLDYVLYDQGMQSSERVGAVECLNLGSDAFSAWREMKATVDASPDLKRRAEIANSSAKTAKPVFHYTLAWHPNDKPGAAHMMQHARQTLIELGLQDHQAVIVQHTDRPHPHVHVVVNLVHPERGHTASLSHFKLKLDRWAHEYERSRIIRSPHRAGRHEKTMNKSTEFTERKAEILKATRERKETLAKKHAASRATRNAAKDKLWERFRTDKTAIYDSHQAALDELWKRRPTTPVLEPAPPPTQHREPELKLWAKALRMLAPDYRQGVRTGLNVTQHRPNGKVSFREALTRIAKPPGKAVPVPKKGPNLGQPWKQVREGVDVMLPIRNTAEARRYAAAARVVKKERSADIRKARDEEVAARTTDYEKDKAALDKAHEAQIRAEKIELAQHNQGVSRLWKAFGEEMHLKPRETPEWIVERDERDAALLSAARGETTKEFSEKAAIHAKAEAAPQEAAKSEIDSADQTDKAVAPVRKPTAPRPRYSVQITEAEAQSQFAEAIRAAGLDLRGQTPAMDGKMHYVPLVGQRSGKSGGYRGYYDANPAGSIRNFKTGEIEIWKASGPTKVLSAEERAQNEAQILARRASREAERVALMLAAEKTAEHMVSSLLPAEATHPYLARKGVQPHGLLQDERGRLVMPLQDASGKLRNVQTIDWDGTKLPLKGAQKTGTYHVLGDLSGAEKIIVAEGFATAATLREATGHTVVVALDAHNLPEVARIIRGQYPDKPMAIAADNDRHLPPRGFPNVGMVNAEKAAKENEATLLVPELGEREGTDFNDYEREYGMENLKLALSDWMQPAVEQTHEERSWRDAADSPDWCWAPEAPEPEGPEIDL